MLQIIFIQSAHRCSERSKAPDVYLWRSHYPWRSSVPGCLGPPCQDRIYPRRPPYCTINCEVDKNRFAITRIDTETGNHWEFRSQRQPARTDTPKGRDTLSSVRPQFHECASRVDEGKLHEWSDASCFTLYSALTGEQPPCRGYFGNIAHKYNVRYAAWPYRAICARCAFNLRFQWD